MSVNRNVMPHGIEMVDRRGAAVGRYHYERQLDHFPAHCRESKRFVIAYGADLADRRFPWAAEPKRGPSSRGASEHVLKFHQQDSGAAEAQ